jgi:ATP-dependent 26S proteasome regulatory subunit
MSTSILEKLAAGEGIKSDDEKQALAALGPRDLAKLALHLVNQRRKLKLAAARAQRDQAAAEQVLQRMLEPPWVPGVVLRSAPDGRLDVLVAGRRQVVNMHAGLSEEAVRPSSPVFLNAELTMVVAADPAGFTPGQVGTVVERTGELAILSGAGDEELAAFCPPELAGSLDSGDRVLYAREYPFVLERLPARRNASFVLEPAPDTRFSDIGGLDDVLGAIRRELDLHLVHTERVARFNLDLMRGLLLAGPAGVGKSMIGRAIANHLTQSGVDARFLAIPPGALRSMWYGQAEARVRELFALARSSPGICVLFFDEIDTLGRRGEGIGQDVDGRVLGSILHEISGVASEGRFLCVGATNRIDLCDPALLRPGRFGDRVFTIPRPGREATRQILAHYLATELPYAEGLDAATLVDAGVAWLYAPEGGAGPVLSVTLRDASVHEIAPMQVMSGSLLAGAVERAKHAAAHRSLVGSEGLLIEDLLGALDEALGAEARKIESPAAARAVLGIPHAREIVRVQLPAERRLRRHRYLRAA